MDQNTRLSLLDTNVLKGVALIFLLIHHLFYVKNGLYDDVLLFKDRFVVQQIGYWSKICVAIFVFLSGYGLMTKTLKEDGIKSITQFFWHRFVKLLMNYWFIWLIFVPIGVFVFGRTFEDAYGEHIILRFILDFFGLLNCFGWYGYNPTWWFYSCIIVLYLSFPFLYKLMIQSPFILMAVVFAIYFIPINQLMGVKVYFPSFVLGMTFAKYSKININPFWSLLLFLVISVERLFVGDPYILDSAIVLCLIFCYKGVCLPEMVTKFFSFLGKHSMNIFLFHTFIYYYWFQEYIYYTRNPFVIFVSLLSACIIISLLLELIKKLLHFDVFVKKIESLYVRQ